MVTKDGMQTKLMQWKDAKANKDFTTADALRAELRSAGLDPDPGRYGTNKSQEEKLEMWRTAKAAKDYTTADAIRAELRASGFDPDAPGKSSSSWDWETEEKLMQWKAAKAAKNFAVADRIRAELRDMGIDPDPDGGSMPNFGAAMAASLPVVLASARPSWEPARTASARPYDAAVEAELDQWVEARTKKDWDTADAIRESLRVRGIEPADERGSSAPTVEDELWQWQRAKQAKDYSRSDSIRQTLRSKGLDPDGYGGMNDSAASYASYGGSGGRGHEAELSKWYDARDRKDWAVADSIRERLRAKGIEPADCPRPHSATNGGCAGAASSIGHEAELSKWYDARDRKDWAVADSIRERLRAKGIEPADCPRPHSASNGGGYAKQTSSTSGARSTPYVAKTAALDEETTSQINLWKTHRQNKDYEAADAIRAELRARGIEPDQYR